MRNPVGPLPSSIYWRRRAVAATLVALLALLIVWIVTQGGGGKKKPDDNNGGAAPATSITPGPSGSGPAISEQPGGRDESGGAGGGDTGGDGDKNGDTSGASDGGGTGPGATQPPGGTGSGGAGGTAAGGTGTGGAGGTAGSTGRQVPVSSTLPTCARNSLTLRLDSTKVAYAPGEKPAFRLVATNTSNTACKADFGPKAVVLTVTNADDDDVWSSKDCPKTGSAYFEVPAGATITRVVQWDRKQSAPNCPTPAAKAKAVGPGTYLVEVKAAGASVQLGQKSIRLDKD